MLTLAYHRQQFNLSVAKASLDEVICYINLTWRGFMNRDKARTIFWYTDVTQWEGWKANLSSAASVLSATCRRRVRAVLWHRAGPLHLQQPLRRIHQTHQAGSISHPIFNPYQSLPDPHRAARPRRQMAQQSARCDLNRGCPRTPILTRLFEFPWGVPLEGAD